MRDLFFVAFLLAIFALGLRRPFLFVLGYVYIDIVSPQRLSYYLLNLAPISLIFFAAALAGWLIADKKDFRIAPRQALVVMLLGWAAWTTLNADFPVEALEKWGWVWKTLVFAIFLPFFLSTRLRIEALLIVLTLAASSIIVTGSIKTILSGGGYGVLNLGVDNNSGLYEGSIISTLAIALIPLILFFAKHGTIFRPDWRVRLYTGALIFACLLIPIGTEARTGLVCIAVLVVLLLRDTRRRILYLGLLGFVGLAALPLLPSSFTKRMDTISEYKADESASTRLAVWGWTWNYVKDHPLGGGFDAYRGNKLSYQTVATHAEGSTATVTAATQTDQARAYHSSYFEMLGEQGWPGFLMWMTLHLVGLLRMEIVRRRFIRAEGERAWIAPLATALQSAHIIYMVGSTFLGIAFQSFVYMWIACEIALDRYCARIRHEENKRPWVKPRETAPEPLDA